MSLIAFVARPTIKEAFVRYAVRDRTPVRLRDAPIRVPSCGKLHGHVGTAFDYLARFHLARVGRGRGIDVHEWRWTAEVGITRLPQAAIPAREAKFWRRAVANARVEAEAYMSGAGDVSRVATAAQILANADVLSRNLTVFDPTFRPLPELSTELVALLELFAANQSAEPKRVCILNPVFLASKRIEGGDADVITDDRLIDFKTTVNARVEQRDMLQIAGYAALQNMGGIALANHVYVQPFTSVALYFSRFGVLVEWDIAAMFPERGFEAFCKVFQAEVKVAEAAAELRRE